VDNGAVLKEIKDNVDSNGEIMSLFVFGTETGIQENGRALIYLEDVTFSGGDVGERLSGINTLEQAIAKVKTLK
jgi:hypothetical protein